MKFIDKIGWGSAWLAVASWIGLLATGIVPMAEGGMAFIGTTIMLMMYAIPVTIHFLAIRLGLRTGVRWMLLLATGLWLLHALPQLIFVLIPASAFASNPPPAWIKCFAGAAAGFFLLQASVAAGLFVVLRKQTDRHPQPPAFPRNFTPYLPPKMSLPKTGSPIPAWACLILNTISTTGSLFLMSMAIESITHFGRENWGCFGMTLFGFPILFIQLLILIVCAIIERLNSSTWTSPQKKLNRIFRIAPFVISGVSLAIGFYLTKLR